MTATAIKSILAGVGGTLVLAAFCMTFIAVEKVLFILPLFVAFNGAMTGFRVVEVMKDSINSIGIFSLVMGIGGGAATFLVVNLTGRVLPNPVFPNFTDMAVYIVISGVTSYLGAKLARRYFNL